MLKKYPWLVSVLLALVSLMISAFTAYTSDRESVRVDVAVTATQQKEDHERLERLERKVDQVLEKLFEMTRAR